MTTCESYEDNAPEADSGNDLAADEDCATLFE